ncbi:MAG: Crp/Fnr family transcriptional regulator [Calditrichaeota bacterium]|nr:Crp/Fnr family transcriptional regulator [Calditrichota bacterium]
MPVTVEQADRVISSRFGALLGRDLTADLIRKCDVKVKSAHSVVFREGDFAAALFILLEGAVKLARFSREGKETVLHIAEAPAVIAEAAIFIGRYPAAAIVQRDASLLVVPREVVMEMVGKSAPFARFLLEGMAIWLKRMVARIEQLTMESGTARVARHLLELYERSSPPGTPLACPKVTIGQSKGDLATMLNIAQPSLSRILRRMQDEGAVLVEGREFTLLDLAALRRMTLPAID